MKKVVKLTEAQLRKLVREAMPDLTPSADGVNPDKETARYVTDALLDVLTSGAGEVDERFVEHLGYALDDDAFYPSRIEDTEPMAQAVAKHVAAELAQSPGFHDWLAKSIASAFRRAQ